MSETENKNSEPQTPENTQDPADPEQATSDGEKQTETEMISTEKSGSQKTAENSADPTSMEKTEDSPEIPDEKNVDQPESSDADDVTTAEPEKEVNAGTGGEKKEEREEDKEEEEEKEDIPASDIVEAPEEREGEETGEGLPQQEAAEDTGIPDSKKKSFEDELDELRVVKVGDVENFDEDQTESDEADRKLYEDSFHDIEDQSRVIGKVIDIREKDVIVDLGFKSEGIIPREEFDNDDLPSVGDSIDLFVETLEDDEGQMILSKKKADFMRVWERVRDAYDNDEIIEGKILRRIKGGMVVDVFGIDAFLPGSQIDVRPIQDFDAYVGQTFEFKIVKLNEARKNIVLSRKEILEENLKERREELLSQIQVGDELDGRVKNITDFGVFVDLGGLDGLLHITDLSWGRVNHPSEVVKLEEKIKVKVIDYDEDRKRVSLGLKQLSPHPWEDIERKYPLATVVKGKIVSITNYGVFVELEKGVEGLIHISEMSWTQHIRHPSELFSMGEVVEAKVLSIEPEERKISLGIKQLEPDPWDEIENKYPIGSIVKGVVRNLTQFGVFVELEEGIDGLIHISDLSWTRKIKHPRSMLSKGDEIAVKILDISKENRKISLGLKQVEEDPWPMLESVYHVDANVEGTVVKVMDKSLIVSLPLGVEGIVYTSNIPRKDRREFLENARIDDKLDLRVVEINPNEKRIALMRNLPVTSKDGTDVTRYIARPGKPSEKIEIPSDVLDKIQQSEDDTEAKKEPAAKKRAEKAEAVKKAEPDVPEEETEKAEPAETKKKSAGEPETAKKAADKKDDKAEKKSDEEDKAELAGSEKEEESGRKKKEEVEVKDTGKKTAAEVPGDEDDTEKKKPKTASGKAKKKAEKKPAKTAKKVTAKVATGTKAGKTASKTKSTETEPKTTAKKTKDVKKTEEKKASKTRKPKKESE